MREWLLAVMVAGVVGCSAELPGEDVGQSQDPLRVERARPPIAAKGWRSLDAGTDGPQWIDCPCADPNTCSCMFRTGGTWERVTSGWNQVDDGCPYDAASSSPVHTLDPVHTRCDGAEITASYRVGIDGWHCEGIGEIHLHLWCGTGLCDLWAPCVQ